MKRAEVRREVSKAEGAAQTSCDELCWEGRQRIRAVGRKGHVFEDGNVFLRQRKH